MIKRIFAILLALTATLNAQTYEYSGKPKDGLKPATFEEAVAVVSQATGVKLYAKDVERLVDQARSHSTLRPEATAPLKQLMDGLGIKPPIANFYALSHNEGTILIQLDPRGSVLRFVSSKSPTNLYVRQTAPAPPKEKPEINEDLIRLIVEILSPEQRVALFEHLKAAGVESDILAIDDKSTADSLLEHESYLVK